MHGRGPYYASAAQVRSGQPLIIKLKRGGPAGSGSGPQGRKATKRALLAKAKAMRERAGVAKLETERQAARVLAKATPPKIIYG